MIGDLVTSLVPRLAEQTRSRFDIFDVVRHGTHEKQISNVFAWLLDASGTHDLGTAFQDIFIDQVNGATKSAPVPPGDYSVRQEVDVSGVGNDIADIVLDGEAATLVVENYGYSDGHGHSYEGYRDYGERDGKRGVVVMLCERHSPSDLREGWEQSTVVTYAALLRRLRELVDAPVYRLQHPQQAMFLLQLHDHFVKGIHVTDESLLHFVDVLCATGEVGRFGQSPEAARIAFADAVREQALVQFTEARDLLQRAKAALRRFSSGVLAEQLNAAVGHGWVAGVSSRYQGIYQWTINFELLDAQAVGGESGLQLKFGPSAWFAIAVDKHWAITPETPDYGRVFVTRGATREIRETSVALGEVLDGLSPTDERLRDAILTLLGR